MNKYQRALKVLSASEQQAWKEGYDVYDLQEAKDLLKELVERATPKKPTKDQYSYDYCPNCGWLVYDSWNGDQRFMPNCENCGQALKWDEEEEE